MEFALLPTDPQSISSFLSSEQTSIATSLWPIQKRPGGGARKKLNKFQKAAIDLACSNQFTLIQGPPGNNLSVLKYIILAYM